MSDKIIQDRPTRSKVVVDHGDVIDLRDTEMVSTKKGERFVRIVLRPETGNNICQVFATAASAEGLITGRITRILRVYHYPKKLRNGLWFNCTDIVVEMENAAGEKPDLVSTVHYAHPITDGKADGAISNFTFRGTENAEKEENRNNRNSH